MRLLRLPCPRIPNPPRCSSSRDAGDAAGGRGGGGVSAAPRCSPSARLHGFACRLRHPRHGLATGGAGVRGPTAAPLLSCRARACLHPALSARRASASCARRAAHAPAHDARGSVASARLPNPKLAGAPPSSLFTPVCNWCARLPRQRRHKFCARATAQTTQRYFVFGYSSDKVAPHRSGEGRRPPFPRQTCVLRENVARPELRLEAAKAVAAPNNRADTNVSPFLPMQV